MFYLVEFLGEVAYFVIGGSDNGVGVFFFFWDGSYSALGTFFHKIL
jgi:hypothetical protein